MLFDCLLFFISAHAEDVDELFNRSYKRIHKRATIDRWWQKRRRRRAKEQYEPNNRACLQTFLQQKMKYLHILLLLHYSISCIYIYEYFLIDDDDWPSTAAIQITHMPNSHSANENCQHIAYVILVWHEKCVYQKNNISSCVFFFFFFVLHRNHTSSYNFTLHGFAFFLPHRTNTIY